MKEIEPKLAHELLKEIERVEAMSEAKQSDLTDLLSFENATHLLECRHVLGSNDRTYYMPCHVIKTMPDGRLKLRVYGDRYWRDTGHIVKTRYVEPNRVYER